MQLIQSPINIQIYNLGIKMPYTAKPIMYSNRLCSLTKQNDRLYLCVIIFFKKELNKSYLR